MTLPNDQAILSALIQAGISRPRATLTDSQIRDAVNKFDPSKPIWPRNYEKKVRPSIKETAARMRAYYLTHGQGCKTRAKAIDARLAATDGEYE